MPVDQVESDDVNRLVASSMSSQRLTTTTSSDTLTTMERDLWLGLDSAIAYISDMATEMAELHRHHPDSTSSSPTSDADVAEMESRDVDSLQSSNRDVDAEESSRLSWVDAIMPCSSFLRCRIGLGVRLGLRALRKCLFL